MADNDSLLKTSLYSRHVSLEARLGELAGWQMPLSYRSPLEEYDLVHKRAAVADVSHIGRLRIRGDGALELLGRLCTADVLHQEDDTVKRTLLCNERGGIIDECLLVRLDGYWLLTTSPINRVKVTEHLLSQAEGADIKIDDQTEKTAMIAVIGRGAIEMLDAALPMKVSTLGCGQVKAGSLLIAKYVAMRTQSCGTWTLEVMVPNLAAGLAWDFITKKAGANALPPTGMLARDILRFEAGLCTYGHEINETIDPVSAGLEKLVDFSKDFLGAGAVRAVRDKGPARRRVGLVLSPADAVASTLPKSGDPVTSPDGDELGAVTGGMFSPSRDAPVAMAYIRSDAAETGSKMTVRTGDKEVAAACIALPFTQPG